MPKSQSKLLATEADFSCSKYTKRGGLRGCLGWESLRIVDREGPASFLKLLQPLPSRSTGSRDLLHWAVGFKQQRRSYSHGSGGRQQ